MNIQEWIEGLIKHADELDRARCWPEKDRRERELLLIGYCSSAKTILKNNIK